MVLRFIILLLIGFGFNLSAQLTYSRVRVFANNEKIEELMSLGVALDHGQKKENVFIETDLSETEIEVLKFHQVPFEVLIDDVQSHYILQNEQLTLKSLTSSCPEAISSAWEKYNVPENFEQGSMAGFFTYQEFLDQLDSMASKYPQIVTAREPISTFQTHEGRPVYHVRISDNAGTDEGEPQVLYTAVHHAREPGSLSQLIFYMWYLLENYNKDAEITYLIDHTEMFFVPMINPDGYLHNEVHYPSGGGMHRKNKRAVGGGNPGVDLNRNYAFEWGVSGVSPDPNHNTYPGPSPFSEPETQAIKWLCENNNFLFASNAHTHGNLLLYPYGYSVSAIADDADYFQAFTNHMTEQSRYVNIKSSGLYPASGTSDDWMYEDDPMKPEIFAVTPEIGYAFWTAETDLINICKQNVFSNLVLAYLPHNYVILNDVNSDRMGSLNGHLKYEVHRLGITEDDFDVELIPLQGFNNVGGLNTHNSLGLMETEIDSVSYSLLPSLSYGDTVKYVWKTDFGTWQKTDTIVKIFGLPQIRFYDQADDMGLWNSSEWDITDEDFASLSTSITDSPFSNYANNRQHEIVLNNIVDLTYAEEARVSFYAKWEIEKGYDYVQLLASTDMGENWVPLCGKYTVEGTANQDEGNPLYDGFQSDWVREEVDLNDFLGEKLQLKFILVSDALLNEDGFYFDDFKVYYNLHAYAELPTAETYELKIYPNPSDGLIFVNIPLEFERSHFCIYDQMGKKVFCDNISQSNLSYKLNLSFLNKGVYIFDLSNSEGLSIKQRLVIY